MVAGRDIKLLHFQLWRPKINLNYIVVIPGFVYSSTSLFWGAEKVNCSAFEAYNGHFQKDDSAIYDSSGIYRLMVVWHDRIATAL